MSGKGFMKNKGFSMIPNQVIWDEDISMMRSYCFAICVAFPKNTEL